MSSSRTNIKTWAYSYPLCKEWIYSSPYCKDYEFLKLFGRVRWASRFWSAPRQDRLENDFLAWWRRKMQTKDIARIVMCSDGTEVYFPRLTLAWQESKRLDASHYIEAKNAKGVWVMADSESLACAILDDGTHRARRDVAAIASPSGRLNRRGDDE